MARLPKGKRTGSKKPRMTNQKAKQIIRREHKIKAKKNMDNFFFQARTVCMLTPQQGVAVSNFLSWFPRLTDPGSAVGVTQNAEFNLYRTMYDKVRINSIQVTITPKANVLDQTAAQQDGSYTLDGQGVVHTVIDRDSQPPASISRLSRYPSYQKYSVMKKFTRKYSVKYPTGVWLDCQNIYSDTTLMTRLGLSGGIYLYAENFVEDKLELFNEPWAEAEIRYNCVFQGKTSANLNYDATTGIVTLKPDQPAQIIPDTPVQVLYGSISDTRIDLSGNIVSVNDETTP